MLITTRRGGFDYLGPVLDLDVFPRPEAITLLRHRAPGLRDVHAKALAEVLGNLPLALEQTAAYLNQTQLPPADYSISVCSAPGPLRCMAGAGASV